MNALTWRLAGAIRNGLTLLSDKMAWRARFGVTDGPLGSLGPSTTRLRQLVQGQTLAVIAICTNTAWWACRLELWPACGARTSSHSRRTMKAHIIMR